MYQQNCYDDRQNASTPGILRK